MNRETVERLDRLERELNIDGRPSEADQAYRLKRVAIDAETIISTRTRLQRSLADAKQHGATLQELADVSGLSVEGVRKIIQRKEIPA